MTEAPRLGLVTAVKARLSGSTLARRFSSGVGWTFIGNVVWRGLSMISTIIVARILGRTLFGGFDLVQSTVAMFAVFAGFRLGSTATRYVARYRTTDPIRAARILKLVTSVAVATCGLAGIACVCAAPWLGRFADVDLTLPLMVAAALMFFVLMWHVMEFVLAGFEAFRAAAVINIGRGVLTPVLCIPLAYAAGLVGVFIGLTIAAAAVLIVSLIVLRREKTRAGLPEGVSLRESLGEHGVLWRFALPGVLSGLLTAATVWVCKRVLSDAKGMDELGLFAAANQWRTLVLFLPSILGRVILPILSESRGAEDHSQFDRAARMNFRAMTVIALPLSVGMIGFADVLAAVFGKRFAGCETVLPVLTVSVFLFCLSAAALKVFDGAGRRWISVAMNVVWAAVCVALTLLLTAELGAVGLAWALLGGYAVLVLMQVIVIELALVRSFVTGSIGVYLFSAVLLAVVCVVRWYLPRWPAYGASAVLVAVALLPGWALLRGRTAASSIDTNVPGNGA